MRVVAGVRDGSVTPLSVVSSPAWNAPDHRHVSIPGTEAEHAAGGNLAWASRFLRAPESVGPEFTSIRWMEREESVARQENQSAGRSKSFRWVCRRGCFRRSVYPYRILRESIPRILMLL